MKGVILAGGTGTRLYPLTRLMNKHLLPVGKYPMVCYGIERLRQGGITDILLVISKQSAGQYTDFLGSGAEFGVSLTYKIQEAAGGIAEALELAEGFILPGERFVVLLGDNLFMDSLEPYVKSYLQQPAGTAKVLLKPVEDARRYGVPVFDSADASLIAYIEEKPEQPKTKFCVTGIYMYDEAVFDIIRRISPSRRGELEITDVNNLYAAERKLSYDVLQGWWSDAGTFQSLREAGDKLRDTLP
ncbi:MULTISPECIES: sugar phosphate nucleotidyltransferase [unclassified Paenibacillus]|uniref:sugar phosphate nucleotidyltransferase n=1 Tax=unclassified Paenibacillus TaxID=185978 RepID=UPI0003E2B7E4|nr:MULTISPECIES: sugar phosphate nucleotidyltransferase [unclassified Paenibacillus]ETT32853.1 glucose-1-phosphate thymidylyltransferase [Paenibacillus sp. FSL R7-269]OMF88788.1 spore coat protein [Paenibacillus sp. FSL R7-0337]